VYHEDRNTRHERRKHHPNKRCVEGMSARGEVAGEVGTGEAARQGDAINQARAGCTG